MNKALFMGVAVAALLGAHPASATLQIAADIGGDAFFCADNTACDTNPAVGVINTAQVTLDGITFSSATAAANSGVVDFLNTASLLITNTNSVAVPITIAVSQTNFTPPVNKFADAGSGVWQGSAASAATLKWFVDPANVQGAATAFDTPGTLVDTELSTASFPVLGFSRTNGSIIDALSSPYSMTEQTSLILGAGESLVNRGQSIIGTESTVPEPSTWAMLGIGFGLMSLFGMRKRRERYLAL